MPIKAVNITHAVINEHAPIFHELIELITECLRGSGVEVSHTINQVSKDRINLIVGHTIFLPPQIYAGIRDHAHSYIVFQLEPLHTEQGFLSSHPAYYEFLRGAKQVWDYSPENARYLAERGIADVRHIPIGYSPRLERIVDPGIHDIDVLFFGVVTPRRRHIVEELRHRGLKTAVMSKVYGSVRDAGIARATIQLNVHQFETSQLEQLRIAYLLNNKRFVVSETSTDNPYKEGVVFCDYKDIGARCEYYLKPEMDAERKRIAKLGYKCLKRIPMTSSIIGALSELRSG